MANEHTTGPLRPHLQINFLSELYHDTHSCDTLTRSFTIVLIRTTTPSPSSTRFNHINTKIKNKRRVASTHSHPSEQKLWIQSNYFIFIITNTILIKTPSTKLLNSAKISLIMPASEEADVSSANLRSDDSL